MSTRRPRNRLSEPAEALWVAGRDYSSAAVLMHQAVADRLGLSVTELKTLDLLQRAGAITAGEIAAHTRLTTGAVTTLIDRLEKKKFVRRVRDRDDRRRVGVTLTKTFGKEVSPLFERLGKKTMTRARFYSRAEAVLIAGFLTATAEDLREEAERVVMKGRR